MINWVLKTIPDYSRKVGTNACALLLLFWKPSNRYQKKSSLSVQSKRSTCTLKIITWANRHGYLFPSSLEPLSRQPQAHEKLEKRITTEQGICPHPHPRGVCQLFSSFSSITASGHLWRNNEKPVVTAFSWYIYFVFALFKSAKFVWISGIPLRRPDYKVLRCLFVLRKNQSPDSLFKMLHWQPCM